MHRTVCVQVSSIDSNALHLGISNQPEIEVAADVSFARQKFRTLTPAILLLRSTCVGGLHEAVPIPIRPHFPSIFYYVRSRRGYV
jgi:hypothetical protein